MNGNCEDVEKFVGLGLNQGSEQWGVFFSFIKFVPERRNETQKTVKCIFLEKISDMRHYIMCCCRNDWALLRSWKCAVFSGSLILVS